MIAQLDVGAGLRLAVAAADEELRGGALRAFWAALLV